MSKKTSSEKLRDKMKDLGLVALGSIWVDPEDKDLVRDFVDHLNYVRHGLTKERKNDGKEKLVIVNNTQLDISMEGLYDKTNENVMSGKKTVKPGKTLIFHEDY